MQEETVVLSGINLTLTRKKVKNINLRVRADGSVAISVPLRCPDAKIAEFVAQKRTWILAAQKKVLAEAPLHLVPCAVPREEALALFCAVSDEFFPLFAHVLTGEKPVIKVRDMKTRWGVCVPSKRQITFSLRLAEKPRAAIEYVVLHEYAHFVRADHSPMFWQVVAQFMPDYKARKKLLKGPAL